MLPLGLPGDDTADPGANFSVDIVAVLEVEAADRADLMAATWNDDGDDDEQQRK